jgi:hypothetical protein
MGEAVAVNGHKVHLQRGCSDLLIPLGDQVFVELYGLAVSLVMMMLGHVVSL